MTPTPWLLGHRAPRRSGIGQPPGNHIELRKMLDAISTHRALLKETEGWQPIQPIPGLDAVRRQIAQNQPLVDSAEQHMTATQMVQAGTVEEGEAIKVWIAAVDRAREIMIAEEARPTVTPREALRLLSIATTASAALERAIARAALPGATDEDKAAMAALSRCADDITRAAGPVGALIGKLRPATDKGLGAHVTPSEIAAVEAFGVCVLQVAPGEVGAAPPMRTKAGVVEAVVGTGLPVAGSLLVALL